MEECVGGEKDDKNDRIDEGKESKFPYGTPPDHTEEGVGDEKDIKNERIDEEK